MSSFPQKILVVEDDVPTRELIVSLLEEECDGYQIETARNGVEALAKIKEQAPTLVLTDINMPGMDGIKLFTQLRTEGFDNLPFVFMSASMSEGKLRSELEKKVAVLESLAFLPKPFMLEQFFAKVASFLGMPNVNVSLTV